MTLLLLACIRPSADYEVAVYGAGNEFDAVLPAPEAHGGVVEYGRYRLWGHNLGHGLTGLFGDSPRQDGSTFVIGHGSFGWPANPSYDRESAILRPGPAVEDRCVTRLGSPGYYSGVEGVDVGDSLTIGAATLPRDPAWYPRPAGEVWYVGYGGLMGPSVMDHPIHPATWYDGETVSMSFGGTVAPDEATIGAIPLPHTADIAFPALLTGVTVNGEVVRAPHHLYDEDGVWDGETEDAVRYPSPFTNDLEVGWDTAGAPVTIAVRVMGWGVEEDCDCDAACSDGFTCEDGGCVADDGASWAVLGEVTCTAADDGSFTLGSEQMRTFTDAVAPWEVAGAVLIVARMEEGTAEGVPAVRTSNGKAVDINPIRVRTVDLVATRVEVQ
jgi:hypothetical protein